MVMGLPFFLRFILVVLLSVVYILKAIWLLSKKRKREQLRPVYTSSHPPYGGVQSFSLMRWENPYKIDNISSGTPGRTNPADKPFKPNNVCNAISYRSQVYRLALKMRNAQRINYTTKCTTIYCVCQHIEHYILYLHFAENFYHGSRRADDAAELPAYSRVSFMYSTSHTKHSLCTLTNACAIAMAIPLFRE